MQANDDANQELTPKQFTLLIVLRAAATSSDSEEAAVLIGEKKRGFGEGYFNGFGGKVEPGESVEEAAQREMREEAGVTAVDMERCGLLVFRFDDVHVFRARGYDGELQETDEMRPVWFPVSAIPFDRMWADDIHWYPLFLKGSKFKGEFHFTQTTRLVWHELHEVESLPD
eukprot:jgi/Chlat1/5004/Chrsp32S04974